MHCSSLNFMETTLPIASPIRRACEAFLVPTYRRSRVMVRGKGTRLWDEEGREYLDLGGGVAVNSLGHAHPAMIRALETQSRQLIHCSNLYFSEPQAKLAAKLVERTGPGKVFFCNSGAEANEGMFKLARRFGSGTGRYEILTATMSFHGRTLAGIAACGQEKVRTGFGPVTPGFRHVPFNDLAAAEQAIGPQTVAIQIEGIQGEGGVNVATPEYLRGLRELTRRHGLLLLIDAVQCGFFRTGCFQSYERILEADGGQGDFLPDAVAMAKSMGGGFPIGAIWMHRDVADLLQPGSHGTTYGGSPLACAVSLAVLQTIEEEGLADNIRRQGDWLIERLRALSEKTPIAEVRGLGGLVGVQLDANQDALQVCDRLAEAGLLLVVAAGNVLRFLPPLNVTREDLEQALEIWESIW